MYTIVAVSTSKGFAEEKRATSTMERIKHPDIAPRSFTTFLNTFSDLRVETVIVIKINKRQVIKADD